MNCPSTASRDGPGIGDGARDDLCDGGSARQMKQTQCHNAADQAGRREGERQAFIDRIQ